MSDNDDPQVKDDSVEPTQEPVVQVDPAVAAGEAAARKYEPTPKPIEGKSYSAEETAKMIEAGASKAVNEALEKQAAKLEKKHEQGDYMTREEFKAGIADERERSSAAVKAQENFINEAAQLGITPGSEGYQKLTATFNDKLAAGAIQAEALADPDMIKALAYASGAIEIPKETQDNFIDLTTSSRFVGVEEKNIPAYAKADLETEAAIQAALKRDFGGR